MCVALAFAVLFIVIGALLIGPWAVGLLCVCIGLSTIWVVAMKE